MNDRLHSRDVKGHEGRIDELAVEISRLTYDQLSHFLGALATELAGQAERDEALGRGMLANELAFASDAILDARSYTDAAWEICAPHMTKKETVGTEEDLH